MLEIESGGTQKSLHRNGAQGASWGRALCVLLCVACWGCVKEPVPFHMSGMCADFHARGNWANRVQVLNLVSLAFQEGCDQLVVQYAAQAQKEFRHKTFSLSKETASIFFSEGVLTDYVLESYERAYLSILQASSHKKMGDHQSAKVELRRLDHELFASLYNFGEDPVNLVLSAVLWEVLGEPSEARVDWFRIADRSFEKLENIDPELRQFAQDQVVRLDRKPKASPNWGVYGLGVFPAVHWEFNMFGSGGGYFSISPRPSFQTVCVSQTGMRIPTESWFLKIRHRHDHAYHPLLHIQSWIRLPIGVIYGLVPFTLGAGVAIGGCVGAASMGGQGSDDLCEMSIRGGLELMEMAPTVFSQTIQPDLRHWERIPASILVTRASRVEREPCFVNQVMIHELVTLLRESPDSEEKLPGGIPVYSGT